MNDHRSYMRNLSSCKKKACKKYRLEGARIFSQGFFPRKRISFSEKAYFCLLGIPVQRVQLLTVSLILERKVVTFQT